MRKGRVVCPFRSESSSISIVRVILVAIVVSIVIEGDSTIVGLRIRVLVLRRGYRVRDRLHGIRILVLIHWRPLVSWWLVITLIISRRVSVVLIVPLIVLIIPLIIRVTTLKIGIAILPWVLVLVKADTGTLLVWSVDLFLIQADFRGRAAL